MSSLSRLYLYIHQNRSRSFLLYIREKLNLCFQTKVTESDLIEPDDRLRLCYASYADVVDATQSVNMKTTSDDVVNVYLEFSTEPNSIQVLNAPRSEKSKALLRGSDIWYLKFHENEVEAVKAILVDEHRDVGFDPFYTISMRSNDCLESVTEIQTERDKLIVDSTYLQSTSTPLKDLIFNTGTTISRLKQFEDNSCSASNEFDSISIIPFISKQL